MQIDRGFVTHDVWHKIFNCGKLDDYHTECHRYYCDNPKCWIGHHHLHRHQIPDGYYDTCQDCRRETGCEQDFGFHCCQVAWEMFQPPDYRCERLQHMRRIRLRRNHRRNVRKHKCDLLKQRPRKSKSRKGHPRQRRH